MDQREAGDQEPEPSQRTATGSLGGAGASLSAVGSVGGIARTNILLPALVVPVNRGTEGQLIQAVAVPWFEIIDLMEKDPDAVYRIHWRNWEEIIAGAYTQAGFDEVVLTPRSNDKGRDVIATKYGVGCIRFFDQVKAYGPDHVVTADDVRAMLGVITGAGNVSKGIVTTTSEFAPGVEEDEYIKPFIPFRLELKPRDKLIPWLESLARPGEVKGES